jgi:hypothetical protein
MTFTVRDIRTRHVGFVIPLKCIRFKKKTEIIFIIYKMYHIDPKTYPQNGVLCDFLFANQGAFDLCREYKLYRSTCKIDLILFLNMCLQEPKQVPLEKISIFLELLQQCSFPFLKFKLECLTMVALFKVYQATKSDLVYPILYTFLSNDYLSYWTHLIRYRRICQTLESIRASLKKTELYASFKEIPTKSYNNHQWTCIE